MEDAWWVQHIFGQSLAAKTNPSAAEIASAVLPQDAVALMTRLFSNCESLFAEFTDMQVAEGLVFLAASGESDWMDNIYSTSVDPAERLQCIRSIESLYRECFARRCVDRLTHMSSDINSLNSVCYMWWDRFPSGRAADADPSIIDDALIEVMGRTLLIEHSACQESALHGLGHWQPNSKERVQRIIDDWLGRHTDAPPQLRSYAQAARAGDVQ